MRGLSTLYKKFIQRSIEIGDTQRAYLELIAGPDCKAKSAKEEGSRIFNSALALQYRKELEEDLRAKVSYTRAQAFAELEEARQVAKESGNGSAMVQATTTKIRMMGWLETRIHHTHSMRLDEAQSIIANLLPKYAHLLPPSLRVIEQNDDEDDDQEAA